MITFINILSVSFHDLISQSIFCNIPKISTGRLAAFILLMFLGIAKNTILLEGVHLAKVINDGDLESEEKNNKYLFL